MHILWTYFPRWCWAEKTFINFWMLYFVLFVWDLLLKLSFPETSFGGFFRAWIALLENNWCKVSTSCMYDCTLHSHIRLIYLCGDISLFFSAIFSKESFHVHFLFDWNWVSQEKWEKPFSLLIFFFAFSPLYFYIHIGTILLMILFVYAFCELVLLILKNMVVWSLPVNQLLL